MTMRQSTMIAFRIVILPAILACLPARSIAAPSYNFGATVANSCSASGKATTVPFGALTDVSGNYTASGSHLDAQDDAASCNQGKTTAKIQRTNLVASTTTQPTGFTAVIPLAASLTTTQGATVSDSSTDPGTGMSTGNSGQINAFTGLKVTATLGTIGTNQLIAGTYTGTITVTLTPTS